jgi:hypothetical protein
MIETKNKNTTKSLIGFYEKPKQTTQRIDRTDIELKKILHQKNIDFNTSQKKNKRSKIIKIFSLSPLKK